MNRIHSIDIAKGILILLLPIQHYWSALSRLNLSTNYDWIILKYQFIVACFFMCAFFVISGICSNFDKSENEFWKGNIKGIVLPYITFTIIDNFPELIQHGTMNKLYDSFVNYPTHCNFWFLFALLGSKTIVYYLLRITRNDICIHCICFALLCFAVLCQKIFPSYNILAIYHVMIASFFVLFGYDMKRFSQVYSKLKKYSLYLFPLIIILSMLFDVYLPVFVAGIFLGPSQIPLFVVVAIIGTMFTLKISEIISSNVLLEFAGKNSLIIYALHFIPMYYLLPTIYALSNANSSFGNFVVFIILLYLIEYICCFVMSYLFSSTRFKVLIGRY